jgi:hypothetical protein
MTPAIPPEDEMPVSDEDFDKAALLASCRRSSPSSLLKREMTEWGVYASLASSSSHATASAWYSSCLPRELLVRQPLGRPKQHASEGPPERRLTVSCSRRWTADKSAHHRLQDVGEDQLLHYLGHAVTVEDVAHLVAKEGPQLAPGRVQLAQQSRRHSNDPSRQRKGVDGRGPDHGKVHRNGSR